MAAETRRAKIETKSALALFAHLAIEELLHIERIAHMKAFMCLMSQSEENSSVTGCGENSPVVLKVNVGVTRSWLAIEARKR